MGAKHATTFRYLAILQIIPKAPAYKATSTIHAALCELGYEESVRTLQRDLKAMMEHLPLLKTDHEGEYRWQLDSSYKPPKLGLDTPTALTLVLAHEYLAGLLPQVALSQIAPQFAEAQKHLDALPANHYSEWVKRVKAIPTGKTLQPAKLEPQIWETISTAVLEEFPVNVTYQGRNHAEPKSYLLHPLAIVARHSVSYLLANETGDDKVKQFALHRFSKAEQANRLYEPASGFDLDTYIEAGGFGYPVTGETVKLVARIRSNLARTLSETALSDNQTLEPAEEGWFTLTATVPDDQETLWWIQGYGSAIDVLSPPKWREHIHKQAREILGKG